MAAKERELQKLKEAIGASFADVPYPKGTLVAHECQECRTLEKTFSNKNWKTVEPQILEENYDKISLLSPEAFHFFLPAYMNYSLEHFTGENTTTEFTIYAVCPTKSDVRDRFNYWKERFENFTPEQMNCIYEFLDLVSSDENYYLFFKEVEDGRLILEKYLQN